LLTCLQAFENNIPTRIYFISDLEGCFRICPANFSEDRGGDPRSSKLANPVSAPMG